MNESDDLALTQTVLWRVLWSSSHCHGCRFYCLEDCSDLQGRGAECARRATARSGRMAHNQKPPDIGQHHPIAVAGKVPGTQFAAECLALHSRKLRIQPHLLFLQRHLRPLLPRMERARADPRRCRRVAGRQICRTATKHRDQLLNKFHNIYYTNHLLLPQNGKVLML